MRRLVCAWFLLCACDRGGPETSTWAPAKDKAPQEFQPTQHHGLAWYEDAPDAAFARARAQKRPVLVDLWAPWCHTCLSMKHFVLTKANLAGLDEQYVFLSLNTERAEHAPLLERLKVEAWPTFYVVDPEGIESRGRFVGAATPQQFTAFLRDGARSFELARRGALSADDPLALLIAGDALMQQGRYVLAAQKYEEALTHAGADWPRKPDALVARIAALSKAKQTSACVDLGLSAMNDTGDTVSGTDFAYHALDCAEASEAADPRITALRERAAERLAGLCTRSDLMLTPDDRSDACALLHGAKQSLGDDAGARAAMETRLTLLEQASAGVPPEVALTYDWARAESLLALERGAEALTFLGERERALPRDYNPPHHLARVYKALGQTSEGLAAIERALSKAYGPRKAALLGVKVDLVLQTGDKVKAKALLMEQLRAYEALPAGQKQPRREALVRERLGATAK